MISLAAMLAHLRDGEVLRDRVASFDAAIAFATRLERELAEAVRALDMLHQELAEEADLAESEAATRRDDQAAYEAAIAAAQRSGKLVRLPRRRPYRYDYAPRSGLDVA